MNIGYLFCLLKKSILLRLAPFGWGYNSVAQHLLGQRKGKSLIPTTKKSYKLISKKTKIFIPNNILIPFLKFFLKISESECHCIAKLSKLELNSGSSFLRLP